MQGRRLVAVLLATGVGASAATVAVTRVTYEPRTIEVSAFGVQGERGPQGEPGVRGEQGPPGERGPSGEQGAPGEQGVPGEQGNAGPVGQTGQRGVSGPRGARGPRVLAGIDGESGATGAAGPVGARGERGDAGPAGAKGDDGPAGPKGDVGEKGATGDKGDAGIAGADGAIGIAGLPGEKGDTGATGPVGPKGDPGGFGAYGSFYDTTDVPLTLGQATPVPLNQTDFASGVSIVNGSEITMSQVGRYNISFSIQLEKTDAGTDWVSIWLRKNGENVPWTNTDVALSGSDANSRTVVAWNFFVVASAAGDGWQLMIASTTSPTGRMLIRSVAPQVNPVRPAIPGTILTVSQVG